MTMNQWKQLLFWVILVTLTALAMAAVPVVLLVVGDFLRVLFN